jgi:hypothetical protein
MRARRPAVLPTAVVILFAATACERVTVGSPAPHTEFVIASADSSYWVRSDDEGIRVRGGPLMLAQVGGRFAELYLTDVDQSFYDAVYVGQRLIKRDVVSGDSMVLFADTLMPVLARAYAAANPDERPLSAEEEGNENPRTIATAELMVLDVHGPWLSYEYRTDIDVIGGVAAHGSRRGVIDLRTGTPTTLEALLGPVEARRVIAQGRTLWREAQDSLTVAFTDQGLDARAELHGLGFDPRSFVIRVVNRLPHVRFSVAQSAARNAGGSYELEGIPVEVPTWWDEVRRGFPVAGESATERQWVRGHFALVARDASRSTARVAFLLRDEGGGEWRLGSVPAPVHRVMWMDDSVVPGTREALLKAFNESAFQNGDVRIVRGDDPPRRRRVREMAVPTFRHASLSNSPEWTRMRSP